MNHFYWLTRHSLFLFFALFYRHKIFGAEHVAEGRMIIAANHTSFLDPPIIAASIPEEVSFLARKSLFSSFLLRNLISRLNAYPVEGTSQDLNSFKMICKLLQENKKVAIFPEGIRSANGQLTEIKSGIGMLAMRNKAPILPIYISGCFDIWSRHQRFPKLKGKTVCVIGSRSIGKNLVI